MAGRDSKRGRVMSLAEVSALLDRDRNTISKWLSQGCPAVTTANKATGQAWELDLAAVVRWLEQRAAAAVAEKFGGDGEGDDSRITIDEAKRRRAIAEMQIAEIEAAGRDTAGHRAVAQSRGDCGVADDGR